MSFFNLSKAQIMRIAFVLMLAIAIINTAQKILLEQYGLNMFPNKSPFAIQDDDVRIILSWIMVGISYMLRNHAIKQEK